MKVTNFLTGIAVLAGCSYAQEEDIFLNGEKRTCGPYPTKLPKLSACATGTAFCQSYIGKQTGSCTRHIISTTKVPQAAVTITETTTIKVPGLDTTVTITAPPVAVQATSTYTLTSLAASCAPTKRAVAPRADVDAGKKPNTSCGLHRRADPTLVSGACNRFLAASTITNTKTVTTGLPISTATVSVSVTVTLPGSQIIVTQTPTTTVYVATVSATTTACATACPNANGAFYLRGVSGNNAVNNAFLQIPASGTVPTFVNTILLNPTPFILRGTALTAANGLGGVAATQTNSLVLGSGFDPVTFLPAGTNLKTGGVLSCAFTGGALGCAVNGESAFSVLAGLALQIYKGQLPTLQSAVTFQGYC